MSPYESLIHAISAALWRDLPNQKYFRKDWPAYHKLTREEQLALKTSGSLGPGEWHERRPDHQDIEVMMFRQTWSSTALGYNGIGGQAFTSAYTVIVSDSNIYCVYFGGSQLAYRIITKAGAEFDNFKADLSNHCLVDVDQARMRYHGKSI